MKKILIALAVVLSLVALQIGTRSAFASTAESNSIADPGHVKVTICHRTGNGGSHEITVDSHAVPAHLAHGDAIGSCDQNPTRTGE